MLSSKWRSSISLFMSFILLFGWIVPFGSHSAYAAQVGVRSAEGTRIATGANHSLLLHANGTVAAWGNNNDGQSDVPMGLTNVIAIDGGSNHSLALKADGSIVAWGTNGQGQTTIPVGAVSGGVAAIAAGGTHSLALLSDGKVVAWGNDTEGQTDVPAGLSDVTAIAAGYESSLALKADGTVVAWGFDSALPIGLNDVVAITAGTYHKLALQSNGKIVAWGNNNEGQTTIPAELAAGGVVAIAAGDHHSLALKADGTVVAWGDNGKGQLNVPAGLNHVVAIRAGWDHSLALQSDGTVVAWGDDHFGQTTVPIGVTSPIKGIQIDGGGIMSLALKSDGTLIGWGSSSNGKLNLPSGIGRLSEVDAGGTHVLALKSDGTVAAWGYNYDGQATVPAGLTDVVAIAAGGTHSLALKSNGTVVGWGNNLSGQAKVPAGLNGVTALAAGEQFSIALKSNGTVVAWGSNSDGQTSVPSGLNGVVAIAAGANFAAALKSDGTVVAWGEDHDNQVKVPAGLKGIVAIAAGARHVLILKSDGTIVAWGDNLEQQTTVPAGLREVVAISAGYSHSLALQADGTVVAWGLNVDGQATVPGNANLSDLTLQEGDFTQSFDPSILDYTYYYDGYSPSSVNVIPTLASTNSSGLYVNNELFPSGAAKTIDLTGAGMDTIIPVRVEPYLQPGQTYTITLTIDSTGPEVQFGTNGQSTSATTAASQVTVTDTQSGVDEPSLQYAWTQSTAVPTGGWIDFDNGDTLIQAIGDGNWYLHIRATDTVGNIVDAVSNRFVLDNTAPTVTVSSSSGGMVNAPFLAQITFSEAVSGLTVEDLAVTNGTASDLVSVSGTTYTAAITPTTSGQAVTVKVVADAAADAVGHSNSESNTLTLLYDTTKPAVTFGGFIDQQQFAVPPTDVSVTLNEAVYWIADGVELDSTNAIPLIRMTKDGDPFSAYTSSYDELTRTFTLSFDDSLEDGDYEVDVAGNVVRNEYANTLDAASAAFTVAIPVITSITSTPDVLSDAGGSTTVAITGTNLTGQTVKVYVDGVEAETATVSGDTIAEATISLPRNTTRTDKSYMVSVYLNGVEVTGLSSMVMVSGAPAPATPIIRSSNAELTALHVKAAGESVELSPAFSPETKAYTAETDAEQIELQAIPANSNAVITLNGTRMTEATTVSLDMGANKLTIMVTTEDGTLKIYTLTINRIDADDHTSTPTPVCTFRDIEHHWANKKICEAAGLGIVEGVDAQTFVPNGYVTRTEFAVMLLRTLQIPINDEAGELSFSDQDTIPLWARSAIQTAVAEGVLTGYTDGTLRPNQVVNRTEMAVMIARAMQWDSTSALNPFFSDDVKIPAWAKTYVEAARKHGILVGRDGNKFQPKGVTSRAEAAVALLRLWEVLN